MTTAVILGSGIGAGLWALAVWLVPPRPALGAVLRRINTAEKPSPILTPVSSHRWIRVGRPLVAVLRVAGLPTPAVRRDLAVLERPVDAFLTEKATLTLCGLLLPAGAAIALGAITGGLHPQVPVAAAVGCAAIGFVAPDVRVRRCAARRRADFRHALSAYLDLVVISLAGGAGVDSALHDSITVGHGWAFRQLERALTAARLTRGTPWVTLQQLGRELDITELTELAASVSLAGTEGARVRQSLTAKAAALRSRELTDAETKAGADTERMSLPVMALLLGFLLFIAYPTVSQVLNGL
ncbi:type II secretion system F family protein [Actinophytocola sp.]|uniref:type II secretion system F family protein n=1 Tax=Actinophytocola sp. TaxID=1872138 RepID=UPI003D6A9950